MKAKKILLALCFFVGLKLIAQPNIPATTPTKASTDVISVFSDAYTNISGTNFNPGWGQGTIVTDTAVSGDNIKKYGNLDYQGTQLGSRVNASSMEKIHFDIYSTNANQIQIFMVNEGNTGGPIEQSVTVSLTQNAWNSIDIPLSSYHSSIVSSISQFKIQYPGFAYHASPYNFYLDNIYFWKSANIPTISGFSFPTKFTNDAPFQITPPTSNSSGAFTYSSSNASVATVSGDMITIVGAGTTTITANQAADANYIAGSTTAVLTVTFAPPTTAPPTPTHLASNVISMYSNAYTNVANVNWYPNWGQSTQILDMVVAGNDIKRYSNLNYQGVEFSSLDVSSMENLHVDVWTPNLNTLQFFLIKFSPNVEQAVTITPTKNGWYSIDIPLSSYNLVDKSQLRQFKLVGSPSGSTIYLDNIYFWRSASSPTITGFSVPAKNLGDAAFTLTAPTSNSAGAFTYSSSNTSVATISGDVVTIVGVGSTTITANQAADGGFNAGSTTATLVVSYPPPPTAAPIPTKDAANVLSVFSDTYTNIAAANFNPNWGQSTSVSNISIGGNTTKRYSTFNYQGIEFASTVNASAYNHLHIDVYTPNCTAFKIFLINPAGLERQVTLNPTFNGWNSYDIPFSSYAGINFANIIQMKFEGTPFGASTVFYDNLYFWTATLPTLGSFTVPSKELGDASFTLTAPTSNSAGAFSYTSSNTSVATISGNTVTILGVGTSTITAIQAADGSFGSTSTTATLTVTLPVLPQAPSTAAPTPNKPAFNVISLYSNAYTNKTVNTWSAVWDNANILDTTVVGNDTKKYFNLNFSGVEFTGANRIDVSNAEYFHIDIWTPNTTVFNIKLVDFGANGSFGGGDDKEHELTFTAPTLSSWTSYDIPMSAFTGLTTRSNLSQMIIVSNNSTVYFDNVYFWANSCLNPVTNPSVSLTPSANNVCAGTSITFTATATNGGSNPNYNFMVNGNSVQNGSGNTYMSSNLMNNNVVTCVITRTDGCANDGTSNSVLTIIRSLPAVPSISSANIVGGNSIALCSLGQMVALYPSVNAGVWANSNNSAIQLATSSNSSSASITSVANGNSNISYTVTGTNGCSSVRNITVNVAVVSTPASISGNTSNCVGDVRTYTTTSTEGVWMISGRGTITSGGVATFTSAGSSSIVYRVTNQFGCSASSTLSITINSLPAIPNIVFAPGNTVNPFIGAPSGNWCRNRIFNIAGSPSNGIWSSTGVVTLTPTGTPSTIANVNTGAVAGAASLTYQTSNAAGCSSSRTINFGVFACATRGQQPTIDNRKWSIYPNPARNILNIDNSNALAGNICITDIYGKQIIQQNLQLQNTPIDISKLSKGIYFVSISTLEGKTTQKFIVE